MSNEKGRLPSEDMDIVCVDCGEHFIFTISEQMYFMSKQLSIPKRCQPCRKERRGRIVADRGWNND